MNQLIVGLVITNYFFCDFLESLELNLFGDADVRHPPFVDWTNRWQISTAVFGTSDTIKWVVRALMRYIMSVEVETNSYTYILEFPHTESNILVCKHRLSASSPNTQYTRSYTQTHYATPSINIPHCCRCDSAQNMFISCIMNACECSKIDDAHNGNI